MTDNVIPISPDVTPEMDEERELIEWFTLKLRSFRDERGGLGGVAPPASLNLDLEGGLPDGYWGWHMRR